ncbi:unnamed protein product [Phaeothamnion confervicola]
MSGRQPLGQAVWAGTTRRRRQQRRRGQASWLAGIDGGGSGDGRFPPLAALRRAALRSPHRAYPAHRSCISETAILTVEGVVFTLVASSVTYSYLECSRPTCPAASALAARCGAARRKVRCSAARRTVTQGVSWWRRTAAAARRGGGASWCSARWVGVAVQCTSGPVPLAARLRESAKMST